jgi:dienelactone hydrolase
MSNYNIESFLLTISACSVESRTKDTIQYLPKSKSQPVARSDIGKLGYSWTGCRARLVANDSRLM